MSWGQLPSLTLQSAKEAVVSVMGLVSPDDFQECSDQLPLRMVSPEMIRQAGFKACPTPADNAGLGIEYGEGFG